MVPSVATLTAPGVPAKPPRKARKDFLLIIYAKDYTVFYLQHRASSAGGFLLTVNNISGTVIGGTITIKKENYYGLFITCNQSCTQ